MPGQLWIVEDHAGEDALGDDEDARLLRDPAFHAHRIADDAADLLAEEAGHATSRRACRQPARLQQQDRAVAAPAGAAGSAGGTSVVLPAPGGATSTALAPRSSAPSRSASTAVTGSSGRTALGRGELKRSAVAASPAVSRHLDPAPVAEGPRHGVDGALDPDAGCEVDRGRGLAADTGRSAAGTR